MVRGSSYPQKSREDIFHLIRSLRGTSDNVTLWSLSKGRVHFSPLYFDRKSCSWDPDLSHFRLMLRTGGEPPVLADVDSTFKVPRQFKRSELAIIDSLRVDFEQPVKQIARHTGLSESAVFKIRQTLKTDAVIIPQVRVNIPALDGRLLAILSPNSAGDLLPAWRRLPLTYISRIDNVEDSSQSRIIVIAALPRGSCRGITNIIHSEMSKIDEYMVHEISAGNESRIPLTTIVERKNDSDTMSHEFFDVRSYDLVRREATDSRYPLDLA